jgi:predicted SAM-dependent methyltransferase
MNRIVLSLVRLKGIRLFLIRLFRIEFWRRKKVKKYLDNSPEPKLQIGCDTNLLTGWLNSGISLKECWFGIYLDAGKPFPFPESSFNYVFSEHLFEHLNYQQATNMLKESYRILKPGGVFRIATPDLQFLIRLYQEPDQPIHQQYIEYSAKQGNIPPSSVFVINRFHTAWGHQIIYDKETLTNMLEMTGFKDVCSCEVGHSKHSALRGVEGHFRVLPVAYNQLETMILEATK